ncbi:unnamed protein product [Urochloa humidicola]
MGGGVVRRVIPSDNSCLLNVVYVMQHNRNKASELRQLCKIWLLSRIMTLSEAPLAAQLASIHKNTRFFFEKRHDKGLVLRQTFFPPDLLALRPLQKH